MHVLLPLLFACTGAPPPADPPVEVSAPKPVAATVAPVPARMAAEPILPSPIVLGGISEAQVESGVASVRGALEACYQAGLASRPGLEGKVLVKMVLSGDGTVRRSEIRSTSLRDPGVEACVLDAMGAATFPPLSHGEMAVVSYPVVFPSPT